MKPGVCDAENAEGIGRGHGLSQQFKRSGRAVLQGGGALGAYQVGVYQALHETGIKLNWIIGTSIGAINGGLIADNTPERRLDVLQEFWRRMQSERVWHHLPAWTGLPDLMSYWTTLFGGISGFVRPNAAAFMGPHLPLGAESAGFYSTTPLRISVGERDQQRV